MDEKRKPIEALILDMLEWIGPGGRPYAEVMEAWRTSCPRLDVWEEANDKGLVEQRQAPGGVTVVAVSAMGALHLGRHRSH